jgi:hypothetical protein
MAERLNNNAVQLVEVLIRSHAMIPNHPNPRTGAAKLYWYSPRRGIFDEQDVAGMWLKYGAKA